MQYRGQLRKHPRVGPALWPAVANDLKRCRSRPGDKWFVDEVFTRIRGKLHYLWRVVDQEGNVLDILVQSRRHERSARPWAGGSPIVSPSSRTTGLSRITGASKAASDVCAGSGASPRQSASVPATMNFATTSALVSVTISMFPPAAIGCFICVARKAPSPFSRQDRVPALNDDRQQLWLAL